MFIIEARYNYFSIRTSRCELLFQSEHLATRSGIKRLGQGDYVLDLPGLSVTVTTTAAV